MEQEAQGCGIEIRSEPGGKEPGNLTVELDFRLALSANLGGVRSSGGLPCRARCAG